jgi:hypothetical protein
MTNVKDIPLERSATAEGRLVGLLPPRGTKQ